MIENIETCYRCGGEVETEVVGDYLDWVCQECGITVNSAAIVENQEQPAEYGDHEVME